jgi:hypothetical protein
MSKGKDAAAVRACQHHASELSRHERDRPACVTRGESEACRKPELPPDLVVFYTDLVRHSRRVARGGVIRMVLKRGWQGPPACCRRFLCSMILNSFCVLGIAISRADRNNLNHCYASEAPDRVRKKPLGSRCKVSIDPTRSRKRANY